MPCIAKITAFRDVDVERGLLVKYEAWTNHRWNDTERSKRGDEAIFFSGLRTGLRRDWDAIQSEQAALNAKSMARSLQLWEYSHIDRDGKSKTLGSCCLIIRIFTLMGKYGRSTSIPHRQISIEIYSDIMDVFAGKIHSRPRKPQRGDGYG